MLFNDHSMPPTGHFHLEVFEAGVLREVVDESNIVVSLSKTILSELLGGAVAGNSITQFGIGTNGSAPAPGNVALTNSYSNAIVSASYPSAGVVMFGFGLSAAEAVGMQVLEFGLLTEGGRLFARKVRASALNKTSDISFNGFWAITF